jgi:hypothetical protein
MKRAGLVLVAATLLSTACHDNRTLVVLDLESGPAGVRSIDVQFTLGGRSQAVTLRAHGGGTIDFPTDEVVEIGSGTGQLDVTAIARDGAGAEVGWATGSAAVVSNKSTALRLTFGPPGGTDMGPMGGDGGMPADDQAMTGPDQAKPQPTAPGAPLAVTATGGVLSCDVTWQAPTDDGGSTIIAYVVTSYPDGVQAITNGATKVTVSGLRDGNVYQFDVYAINGVGPGPRSDKSAGATTMPNLSKTAVFTANTTYSGYSATRANDGDPNTSTGGAYSWCSDGSTVPSWLQIDLGGVKALHAVRLYTSRDYPLTDFDIQVLEGTAWTTVDHVVGNSAALWTSTMVAGKSVQQLRVVGNRGPSPGGDQTVQPKLLRVNEFEIF